MPMTMGAGRVSHFDRTGSNQKNIYDRSQQHRPGSAESVGDETDSGNNSSPLHAPRFVKSLVSGRILHPEPTTTADKSRTSRNYAHNNSPSKKQISERVVIDPKFRQKPISNKAMRKSEPTSPTSPSSFFASIGACAGVGVGRASFLKERSEETRFEYHLGDANCDNDGKNFHERRVYNCYGSPGRCNKNVDENEEEEMVRFSDTRFPVTKSTTCTTTESSKDSVLILNSRDNTVTVESIGGGIVGGGISGRGGVKLNHATTNHDAFSHARRLLFGQKGTATEDNNQKQSSSFRCNSQSNVLCSSSDKQNLCLSPADKSAPCGTGDNSNTSFMRWYSQESSVSPQSEKSFDRSSFSPSKTIYAAAYGDDDAYFLKDKENDEMSPHPSSVLRSVDGESHREIWYWRRRLHYATKHYGNGHSSTADAYFNLGRAQMNLSPSNSSHIRDSYIDPYGLPIRHPREVASQQKHRYDLAIENLTIAHGILERKHGPEHLAVGRALDSLALAIVKRANHDRATSGASSTSIKEDLRYARRLLEKAFSVRVNHLGVWHVDTVETYNKLAGVLLHLGLLSEACRAYREVFLVRRAIFGNQHPSVAISAHSLANVCYKRGNIKESLGWYKTSLEVYEAMGLSYRHPAVNQLLRDQSRLEEYMELEVAQL